MRVASIALILLLALPSPAQNERRRVSSPTAYYDDAELTETGTLVLSQYVSYDRVRAGHDLSAPATNISLGLHPRLEVSGSVGMVRSDFEQLRITSLADSDFGLKILLLPEKPGRPGVAVKPGVEVLGAASLAGNVLAPSRVNYLLPLLAQKSFDRFRFYYSAGYLTRGIVFHSLAWELNQWQRVTPTAIVSSSRLTRDLGLVSDLGLNRSRTDVLGGVTVMMTPSWGLFASAGRSVGRLDPNSARYQVTAGFTYHRRLWGER
ncbi:MAG: hypothetical protein HY238_24600 [Acidobacteria bacterium]|nr:hypothetical protein [Acidobacteriota bacterium]